MFDDFIHNDFSDLNLNHAHQDAILHAQNQAMEQATRAQKDATLAQSDMHVYASESKSFADDSLEAMNLDLLVLVQNILHSLFRRRR